MKSQNLNNRINATLTWTTLYRNENTRETQAFFFEVATTETAYSGAYRYSYFQAIPLYILDFISFFFNEHPT